VSKHSSSVRSAFGEAVDRWQCLVLQTFDQEIVEKQLCHHTREHVAAVRQRARRMFEAVRPYLQSSGESDRLALLLDLCATAHDLVQVFTPQIGPHKARQREPGISEAATIERLFQLIESENRQNSLSTDQFTSADRELVREAIMATVCAYDSTEDAVYQPALYQPGKPVSPIARILALADIGSLGMEGIDAYNREGSLLFLEENPDARALQEKGELSNLADANAELAENIRQRLLRRARFQVSFARSRLKRGPEELRGLPSAALPALTDDLFARLTPETLRELESTTPVGEAVPFEVLVNFFRFDQNVGPQIVSVDISQ